MKQFFLIFLGVLMMHESAPAQTTPDPSSRQPVYLFAYFKDNALEGGLHLAVSRDGHAWQALEDGPRFEPKVGTWDTFRDPSILQDREGLFHLVWTADGNGFGYARSRDLRSWEDTRLIPINEGPLAGDNVFTWAPELFFDEASGMFYIFFSTATEEIPTLPKHWKGNHRSYFIKTKDFKDFTEPRLVMDPPPDVVAIDGAMIHVKDRYYFFIKYDAENRIDGKKDAVHYASAPTPEGPWSALTEEPLPGMNPNSEAPSPIRIGDYVYVYYDVTGPLGAVRSKDMKTWENVTDRIDGPPDFRHGTVIRLDDATAIQLPDARK